MNSCRLGLSLGVGFWTSTWCNGVWFGCLVGGESDLESESPDPSPVVLVARLAFWAVVILPRLFSKATALVN